MQINCRHVFLAVVTQLSVSLGACTSIDHAAACSDYLAKAEAASTLHDYPRVQELLKDATREADASNDSSQKRTVLQEQATNYLALGNGAEAEAAANRLLKIYEVASLENMSRSRRQMLSEGRNQAQILLADALLAQKRPEEAVKVLSEARNELTLGSPDLAVQVNRRYAAALRATGKNVEGTFIDGESDIMAKFDAEGMRDQANSLITKGQIEASISLLKKAQQIAIKSGSDETYMRVTYKLASAYYLLGHLSEAHEEAVRAMSKIKSATVSQHYKAPALAILALVSVNPSESSKALKNAAAMHPSSAMEELTEISYIPSKLSFDAKWRECALIWELAPNVNAFQRRHALVQRYRLGYDQPDQNARALAWFLEHAQARAVPPEEQAFCFECAASILTKNKRAAESAQNTERALHIREHLKDSQIYNKAEAAMCLAANYAKLGRMQESLTAAQRGLALNPAPNANQSMLLNICIARSFRNQQKYPQAIENYDKALVICRKNNFQELNVILTELADANAHSSIRLKR